MWQHWPGPSNRATILLTKRAIRLINQFNPSNKLTKDQLHPPKIIPPTKYDYSWSTFTTSCDLQIIIILHMWQFSVCDKNVNACGLVGLSLPTETTCNEFPKKTSEEILYWEQIHTQTLHSFLEEFVFFFTNKVKSLEFLFLITFLSPIITRQYKRNLKLIITQFSSTIDVNNIKIKSVTWIHILLGKNRVGWWYVPNVLGFTSKPGGFRQMCV